MTARQLAARLAGAGVTAAYAAGRLTLSALPPADLAPAVRVLRTGLAAAASGRGWWRCRGDTGHWERLSVDALLPAGVTILTVEGAPRWDRVRSAARLDLPHLFAPDVPVKAPTRKAAQA